MRLRFFYGWVIVVVTFVTMAIGVNARTAFSLFFPPIIDEFGWERGITAGAFSFGFVVSGAVSCLIGRLMDGAGSRAVMELCVALMAGGLLLAPLTTQPWHLYLTIGVMVGAGSVCLGYSGQSLFLPNWFVRRRGLAIGMAFAGVGVGSITLLPWLQVLIQTGGWRTACWAMGVLVLLVLAPINLLLRKSPQDLALQYSQSPELLYIMIAAQGALGYGLTSVFAAIVAEIFQGKHYGSIFGTLMLAAIAGGALGPWATGALHDAYGNYALAFLIGF